MSDEKQKEVSTTTNITNNYSIIGDWGEFALSIVMLFVIWTYAGVEIHFEKNGVSGIYVTSTIGDEK